MAESSKRQRLRGSSSTVGGRRRRQPSPAENSPSPSPPPSPTAPHQNLQFSTPALAQRMKKALRPGAPLPYPTLVTRILEHFEVPLEDEIFVPPSRHCTISAGVIQSFGLTQNADNRWVHRNSPPPHQHQNQPPPQLQPQPRPQQQTNSFHDVMRGINDLRTFVEDNFNTLNESMNARFEQLELNMGDRFDTIDARVEHVEHDIDYLRRHFGPHGGPSS
ncbi:hypothetical protein LR48_Vigan10g140600 [Vigna angularis]|uniref:Uncharacterized protein n=1 Tax=Phaseolus angularis TaxID=3914 RepID=A0A0L9VLB7_PHAAN|nr:hypothetical protein LR48_Vigan10g140600 [Vigna angularis]